MMRRALVNPSAEFAAPRDVLRSAAIGFKQKEAILCNWQDEVIQLMRACEENMDRVDDAAELGLAERLMAVRNALTELRTSAHRSGQLTSEPPKAN